MADALLDTTFFIDLHRGDAGARRLWERLRGGDLTGSFSTITAFELWVGSHVSESEEDFYDALFFLLDAAARTLSAATQAGLWLRGLPERVSESLVRDALIAATAAERSEVIYTRNVRDFQRFYTNVRKY